MKFTITTTASLYRNLEDVENLKTIGFVFLEDRSNNFHKKNKSVKIEINSIEELISFTIKFGDIIVNQTSIEIYDGYRES